MSKGNKSLSEFTGIEKAAVLLVALGPDKSALLFKNLKDDEIEQLTLSIANLRQIGSEDKNAVLEEFYQICLAQEFITEGGVGYAKEVLEKAMGSQKASEIISKLTSSLQVRPFDFVQKANATQILNFIQNEHPQTLALLLSYLKPEQSAQILSALPQEKQADVAMRIAQMESTTPEIIKEVETVLERKLSSMVSQDLTAVGGIDTIVEILNSIDRSTEKYIMEALEIQDPDISDEIRKKMFVFEDILSLDKVAVQRFLRDVDNKDLTVALKGASEDVKALIFQNVSKRMMEMIKEDMEYMGPVRLKDVEDAQQKIVSIIRVLEEQGQIIISRGGGDELIV